MPDIASEMFGDMRCLTPEENERKSDMYKNMSEPVKEYIEREAVEKIIKKLYQEPKHHHTDEDFYAGVCAVAGGLATLPTADVAEVVHGEWVRAGFGITERVVCSNCKSDKGSYMKPPFCSQCGAKMDGKKNV